MIKKISADHVSAPNGELVENTVLVLDGDTIIDISTTDEHDANEVEFLKGIIVPGFINTHCHLELSHMLGKIPTGTGLLDFIDFVVKYRGTTQDSIAVAIATAEQQMIDNGIVAVEKK